MVRPVPAGRRRGTCCTPYSRLQEEIDNVETIAVTANNTANNAAQTAQQALTRDTFDDVNVNGDLNVYGDIIQQGAAYETHAQHVFSTDDYIVMRDGALVGLAVGDYSGFQVVKYDGTNDGRLVIDRDGTARVGDVGDEQPLLTRDESADMVDAAPLVWDAANSKAVSGAFPVPDPGVATINGISPDADNDFTIEAGTGVTITAGTNKITIEAAGGGGAWTELTSGLWSQLVDQDTGKLLYDVMIIPKSYNSTIMSSSSKNVRVAVASPVFFPKDTPNMNTAFYFTLRTDVSYWDNDTNTHITGQYIYYGFNSLNTPVTFYVKNEVFTIDGGNNDITISSSVSNSGTKSNVNWTSLFKVLYR